MGEEYFQTFNNLDDLIRTLERNPDEAYIHSDHKLALMYDSDIDAILILRGNFEGSHEVVSEELRRTYEEQHGGKV